MERMRRMLEERFLRYVAYDTMSDEHAQSAPSSAGQLCLANLLVQEMKEIGIADAFVDEYGIVYGHIPANTDQAVPSLGLIAHMDTSPDMSGANVKARIIHNYDGEDIVLNEEQGIIMHTAQFPQLKNQIGNDLIVTDGTTLLGADDKAGIAEIMSAAQQLIQSGVAHGQICIAFTPDEEIGRGTKHFDLHRFGADFAYTVDGGAVDVIAYENFNAASAQVKIKGTSIHPGSAKGKMVNALLLAMEFHALLPRFADPACTQDYEGFHHLHNMQGACETCEMEYIIREHDETKFERLKQYFMDAQAFMNQKYGAQSIHCTINDSYYNMRKYMEPHPEVIAYAKQAMAKIGIHAQEEAIRGGTDGAMLTYQGLPCPNLGTGGYNYHGKYEYACVNEMKQCVELLLAIIAVVMETTEKQ